MWTAAKSLFTLSAEPVESASQSPATKPPHDRQTAIREYFRLSSRSDAAVVAVVGDLLEDVVVWMSDRPHYGSDTPSRIFRSRGGSAANVAVALSSQVKSRFIGRVGADATGDALIEKLVEQNVEVQVQRGGRTGAVVVLVDPTGQRTMFPDRGSAQQIEELDSGWLRDVSWLHLPLYGFETEPSRSSLTQFALTASARGISLSLDASSSWLLATLGQEYVLSLFHELKPLVVFANIDEANYLHDYERTLEEGQLLIVKNSASPVRIIQHDTKFEIPTVPNASTRDTTGAGDWFAAGFIASFVSAQDTRTAVENGFRTAMKVLSRAGADG